jgi:hypothetical protein
MMEILKSSRVDLQAGCAWTLALTVMPAAAELASLIETVVPAGEFGLTTNLTNAS